eukprot:4449771-Karenia_brevis.AAC.1
MAGGQIRPRRGRRQESAHAANGDGGDLRDLLGSSETSWVILLGKTATPGARGPDESRMIPQN